MTDDELDLLETERLVAALFRRIEVGIVTFITHSPSDSGEHGWEVKGNNAQLALMLRLIAAEIRKLK